MNFIVSFIGSFLVKNYGKTFALSFMFSANKVFLFTLITSFILILFEILFIGYNTSQQIVDLLQGLSSGSTVGGGCAGVLLASFLDAIGFFDAFNVAAPALFLIYFAYFNVVLLSIGIRVYRFIDKTITEFALIVK